MYSEYEPTRLQTLIREARERKLLLPNFQRRFDWSTKEQASLAASVLLGIPSGAILLLRGRVGEFSCKALGDSKVLQSGDANGECRFLLDGQQRLTTLRQIFGNPYKVDWEKFHQDAYRKLRYRWSLRVRPQADEHTHIHANGESLENRFGIRSLKFQEPPLDPELLTDWFEHHKILKTEKNPSWFHPAYRSDEELKENELALDIGNQAAKRNLVPLWGVSGGGEHELSLETERAINKLAQDSYDELLSRFEVQALDPELMQELTDEAELAAGSADDSAIRRAIEDRRAEWGAAFKAFLKETQQYKLPVIEIPEGQLAQAVVIFEAINRSGKPLSTFDLIGARYAKMDAQGRSLIDRISDEVEALDDGAKAAEESSWIRPNGIILDESDPTETFKTYFHQGLTLRRALGDFSEGNIAALRPDHVKKDAALALKPEEIDQAWRPVTTSIYESWRFLQVTCSVPSEQALRNKLLMIPLMAAYLIPIKQRGKSFLNKLTYWFWAATLTGRYGAEQNRRCIEDSRDLLAWILNKDAMNPFAYLEEQVLNVPGYSNEASLIGEEEAETAANVGDYLCMFVNATGGEDLLTGKPIHVWKDAVEKHHIVPLGSVKKIGQAARELRKGDDAFSRLMNSPLNYCYLTSKSNSEISAMPVEQYIRSVEERTLHSLRLPTELEDFQAGTKSNEVWVREMLKARHKNIRGKWRDEAKRLAK